MSDAKSVISLLVKNLNLLTGLNMKPEYFRLAKFSHSSDPTANTKIWWDLLHILCFHIIIDLQKESIYNRYDKILAVKMCFASMEYPEIEFYSLTKTDHANRELLLAFAWLIGTQDVLNKMIHQKLRDSLLGSEYSNFNIPNTTEREIPIASNESLMTQINNIIQLNGKVNYNLKEMNELITRKNELTSKVHVASANVCGLPHLSVAEIAARKKKVMAGDNDISDNTDSEFIKKLQNIAEMLDTHMKWRKKQHVFFDWMVTVIEEHKKKESTFNEQKEKEVKNFISFIRHVTTESTDDAERTSKPCVSRLLKTTNGSEEINKSINDFSEKLRQVESDLASRSEELSNQLKIVLNSIPVCVKI